MSQTKDPVVIVASARTPMGRFLGVLSPLRATELGSASIQATIARSGIDANQVQEVIFGQVLSAGQGQSPARQAALGAQLPLSAHCTTINKVCGSGMKAAMLAHDLLLAGGNEVMIAGGMESMSNAPYLLLKTRGGMRLGHGEVIDHMFLDGLEDAYNKHTLMGVFAEKCAKKFNFSRETQDQFAITSLERAISATEKGYFEIEIEPIWVTTKKEKALVSQDEQPFRVKLNKIPTLPSAFKSDGTVTAANSSSISDGAAALLMMRESTARKHGLHIEARVLGHATHAQAPDWFTTAPVGAIQKLLKALNWRADEIDLYEINEAFAVVTLAAMDALKISHERVNIHGGACALGHPIGASGARILVTLISALKTHDLSRGIAALCIGGGEGTAMAIERVH